jgi:glycosyltransferase involved in cell wall biosynthesis
MLKIALLTEKYPPDIGGLAVSVARLARLLRTAGHIVHVFSLGKQQDSGASTDETFDGITIYRLAPHRHTSDTNAAWYSLVHQHHQALQGAGQGGYDLLHAYFLTQAGFVAVYAGKTVNLPVVVSARGNDLDRAVFDPGKAGHILYALQNASVVTANSQELVSKARALAPGQQVVRIPNGVDAELFKPQARSQILSQSLGLDDRFVIGFVGEARAKKGLATMLLAAAEADRQREICLLMVGGVRPGQDEETLAIFCKQHPDFPLVVTGYIPRDELPAYYGLMDVFIMPSLYDGLPNALLEGMACERAVVATPVGGIRDALDDSHSGVLVPPGDASALAEAICSLISQPEERHRLGLNARQAVLEQFTLAQELEANLSIYDQMVRK